MRRVLGISCFGVLLFLLRCNGKLASDSDAGVDVSGGPCASDSDCPSGSACRYPIDGGCSASKQCIPQSIGACKAMPACSCDGTQLYVCNGATQPVAYKGQCEAGTIEPCQSLPACEACDVTGYTPISQAKPIAEPGACTSQQLQAFVTACDSSLATQATCNAWLTQDSGACAACLKPVLVSAAEWGPFVCDTSTSPCTVNSGGCVDLVLNAVAAEKNQGGAGSCGDLIAAENGCLDYACGACPPADLQTCDQSATANQCKSYVDPTTSTIGPCGALQGDAAPSALTACFPQSDADNVNFVNLFCGTGP